MTAPTPPAPADAATRARTGALLWGETVREAASRFRSVGRCPEPLLRVPAPGEVGLDYKALCPCGARVRVTKRGLYAHHNERTP